MRAMQCSTHLSGEWRLNGDWNDCCKDAAVEGTHKLSSLVWSEDQRHSVTRLYQLATTQLVEHVMSYLLWTVSQLACQGGRGRGLNSRFSDRVTQLFQACLLVYLFIKYRNLLNDTQHAYTQTQSFSTLTHSGNTKNYYNYMTYCTYYIHVLKFTHIHVDNLVRHQQAVLKHNNV